MTEREKEQQLNYTNELEDARRQIKTLTDKVLEFELMMASKIKDALREQSGEYEFRLNNLRGTLKDLYYKMARLCESTDVSQAIEYYKKYQELLPESEQPAIDEVIKALENKQ